jgi:SAM-dependent methyltransferase
MFLQDLTWTGRWRVTWSFDSELTRSYTRLRQAFIAEFLEAVAGAVSLRSAIDVGCGIGYFSKFLYDRGFQVVAVDGRDENAKEGHRRYPEIMFHTMDVEDASVVELGLFDLVLCVGLLYHLENPFRAIRNLYALTGKVAIIESMCAPGSEPDMLLLDEGHNDNQGLNYIAFYPTESCLVKMLYRAGFPFVYLFRKLPEDTQFTGTRARKQSRTFLAASKVGLSADNLLLAREPIRWTTGSSNPWNTSFSKFQNSCRGKISLTRARLARFFRPSRKIAVSDSFRRDSSSK